ncbi:MAG: LapA family protein [Rhodospirillales bacterium]|jgi:uncharacterized integral membrane protein|nr:LapA family protein [Rhodospirillales bacterium]MDP6803735.1 LapA family protein [Rhodospirillales bacterium]
MPSHDSPRVRGRARKIAGKLAFWAVAAPIAVAAIVFSSANRGPVQIDLWPFEYPLEIRVFELVLASAFGGFVLGGFLSWLAGVQVRRRARHAARDVDRLSRALTDARERIARQERDAETGNERAVVRTIPTTSAAA